MNSLVVAIDGPAGAGKSTVARRVAQELALPLVDTGAIYRGVALLADRRGIAVDDEAALAEIAASLKIDFEMAGDRNRVFVNGEDVSDAIRSNDVSMAASAVSRHPRVREALLELQRSFAGDAGAVLEGRDVGTVVVPDAPVKFFLDASPQERATRRFEELREHDAEVRFEDVLDEVIRRDEQDRTRAIAPLRAADDARVLDSTELSVDQVVAEIVRAARGRAPSG